MGTSLYLSKLIGYDIFRNRFLFQQKPCGTFYWVFSAHHVGSFFGNKTVLLIVCGWQLLIRYTRAEPLFNAYMDEHR